MSIGSAPTLTAATTESDGARILVVDDNEANTALLAQVLEAAGFSDVECCNDATAAVATFRRFDPDLVLLDLHMPVVDGGDLLQQLNRCVPEDGFVPVMVITADVTEQARNRSFLGGAADFLTKPVDVSECVLRVRNLLHIRHVNVMQSRKAERLAERMRIRDALDERRAAQQHEIHRRLDEVLDRNGPDIVLQPIASIGDGSLSGYEALSRFNHPDGRTPDVWFADAEAVGRGIELELRAVVRALDAFDALVPGPFLSINASPRTVASGELVPVLTERDPSRIVVELTEHDQVADCSALLAQIAVLRDMGVRIAVDDAGTGFAGLQRILQLGPDIIKLDRFLIEGVDHDAVRRALVTAMVAFSASIGATLLGEGIETTGELDMLRSLHVPLGQGYLLGRPAPADRWRRPDGALLPFRVA
jgi:EAL domain-containing protein (putative c-di-GMP-specific phosphodiesterase class I)